MPVTSNSKLFVAKSLELKEEKPCGRKITERVKRRSYRISLRHIWQLQYSAAGTIIYSSRTEDFMFMPECSIEQDMLLGLPVLMQLEDSALLHALRELSERERYIFLARAVDGKSFEALAEETGMGYKGVASVYYRTVQKIKRKIEVMKNEF